MPRQTPYKLQQQSIGDYIEEVRRWVSKMGGVGAAHLASGPTGRFYDEIRASYGNEIRAGYGNVTARKMALIYPAWVNYLQPVWGYHLETFSDENRRLVFRAFLSGVPERQISDIVAKIVRKVRMAKQGKRFINEDYVVKDVLLPRMTSRKHSDKAQRVLEVEKYVEEFVADCSRPLTFSEKLLSFLARLPKPAAGFAVDWICDHGPRNKKVLQPADVDWSQLREDWNKVPSSILWTYEDDAEGRRAALVRFNVERLLPKTRLSLHDQANVRRHDFVLVFLKGKYPEYSRILHRWLYDFDSGSFDTKFNALARFVRGRTTLMQIFAPLNKTQIHAFLTQEYEDKPILNPTEFLLTQTPLYELAIRKFGDHQAWNHLMLQLAHSDDALRYQPIVKWIVSLKRDQYPALLKTQKVRTPDGEWHEFTFFEKLDELHPSDLTTSVNKTFENLNARVKKEVEDAYRNKTEVISRPPPLDPRFKGVKWLVTPGQLVVEGHEMDHCVVSYIPYVKEETVYILALQTKQCRTTAEIAPDTLAVRQHKGYKNREPCETNERLLGLVMESLRSSNKRRMS